VHTAATNALTRSAGRNPVSRAVTSRASPTANASNARSTGMVVPAGNTAATSLSSRWASIRSTRPDAASRASRAMRDHCASAPVAAATARAATMEAASKPTS